MKRKNPLLSLFPCVLLLVVACDQGEELEPSEDLTEEVASRAGGAAEGADAELAPRGKHRRGEHAGHGGRYGAAKLARLCETLECTEDQLGRIEALAERLVPPRGERGPRDEAAIAAANRTLADAVRSDRLAVADLEAWRTAAAAAGKPERGPQAEVLVPAVIELHGILDATQRDTLAGKIERHGLPFAGGGKGGTHHGRRAKHEERSAHQAERWCERLACEPGQQEQIATLLQARPEREEVDEAARQALAAAFRGESLAEADVRAYLDAAARARTAHREAKHAHVVALHGVLTESQRAVVADRVHAKGLRALGVGKGRHGKKKHRRGDGEGRRGRKGKAQADSEQHG